MDIITTPASTPVTEPTSSVTGEQLRLANEQGRAVRAALHTLAPRFQLHHAGDYLIAFYSTPAEGRYGRDDGLRWREAAVDATTHLAVVVLDAADNRFVPGLDVMLEIWRGKRLLTVDLPFEWHPVLHHYGADAAVPNGGRFGLVVRIAAPAFLRHDQVNGLRYASPVVATFTTMELARGRDVHPHATPRGEPAAVTHADS